ncbi:MAG: hypothetical protein N0E48_03815 [Candidatus Thiodiazotropha endolucinida]|nr:hypothetical protein [Candidatus Thiodiazotropha taylori]MCW4342486.1 hypothetical protein [Candidatus Thiodiazotropha endolucinida]
MDRFPVPSVRNETAEKIRALSGYGLDKIICSHVGSIDPDLLQGCVIATVKPCSISSVPIT